MRPGLVNAGDEEADPVRSLSVVLCVRLGTVTNLGYQAFDGDGARVGHLGREALLFHKVGEDTGVGGETGEGDAKVVIYADDFLLVRGEFFGVALGGGY